MVASIDRDVEKLLEKAFDEPAKQDLARRILQWEADRVHMTRRYDKKNELESMINEYMKES